MDPLPGDFTDCTEGRLLYGLYGESCCALDDTFRELLEIEELFEQFSTPFAAHAEILVAFPEIFVALPEIFAAQPGIFAVMFAVTVFIEVLEFV